MEDFIQCHQTFSQPGTLAYYDIFVHCIYPSFFNGSEVFISVCLLEDFLSVLRAYDYVRVFLYQFFKAVYPSGEVGCNIVPPAISIKLI